MKPTDKILIVDDCFNSSTVKELYFECQKHFEKNLLFSDEVDITHSIIDCHGLALSPSKYFPYSVNCWNILCLKIKKYVSEYCSEFGYDESFIVPFSCWAERVEIKISKEKYDLISNSRDILNSLWEEQQFDLFDEWGIEDPPDYPYNMDSYEKVTDTQVKKHFLRSVYNLSSPDPFFGTSIFFDKEKKIPAKQNRLLIYDGGSYPSAQYYPERESDCSNFRNCLVGKYNIIFDWYINDPFDVPDWILP
jgi:hypothetical protein